MNRNQITRDDFPAAGGGYDRASVDAHLVAVAAWTDALHAQVTALEVERDALRRQAVPSGGSAAQPLAESAPAPASSPSPGGPALEADAQPSARAQSVDDEVSARLVATRLALEGSGREEIVARLAETYELENPAATADEVLKRLA